MRTILERRPAPRNLLQLQFNKLDPAVADIPQGASGICILPEEIPSLQVYLAIALIWRTFCQDASAYSVRRELRRPQYTRKIARPLSTSARPKRPETVRIYIGDDVSQRLFRVSSKTNEPQTAAWSFRRRLSEDLGSHIRTLNDDRCGIDRMLMVSRCVARRYRDVQQRHMFICEYGNMKRGLFHRQNLGTVVWCGHSR